MNIFFKYTLNILRKNRTRTLVTILGIILSVSMITAVSLGVTSLHSYLQRYTITKNGNWYGMIADVTNSDLKKIKADKRVHNLFYSQPLGYGTLKGCKNEYKPYLYVLSVSEGFVENMPVSLISGRFPRNNNEVVLPHHLWTNGRVKYAIGDSLKLEIGRRDRGGNTLWQDNEFIKEEKEKIVGGERREYRVVGFYERPNFEPFSAPGYTALTMGGSQKVSSCHVYFKTRKASHILGVMEKKNDLENYKLNSELISLERFDFQPEVNFMIYGIAGILLILIMIGSVSLIYNSFSISLGERLQQFGMISSLGATKKQLQTSVFFEALILSGMGVPLGVLSGVAGLGITFYFVRDYFACFLTGVISMDLAVEPVGIFLAMGLGLITVLISAWIPAKKVLKLSPIEAMSQSGELHDWKKIRILPFTYLFFGLEGVIAAKNFKRSKRKYRVTIFSLFISVLLFITASSFSDYMQKIIEISVSNRNYDLSYSFNPEDNEFSNYLETYQLLTQVRGIKKGIYHHEVALHLTMDRNALSKEYLEFWEAYYDEGGEDNTKKVCVQVMAYFVEDQAYITYLEKNHLYEIVYGNFKNPKALVYSRVQVQKNNHSSFMNGLEGKEVSFKLEQGADKGKILWGQSTEADILGIDMESPFMLVMYPLSAMKTILDEKVDNKTRMTYYFKTNNHRNVYEKMNHILVQEGYTNKDLYDAADEDDDFSGVISVIRVFSYGFIALISLIVATNVFNTIFTNFNLRRREFAMLKSVGMTEREFLKMMYYECFWYGIKALMYGIPISLVLTYGVYRITIFNMGFEFSMPWRNVCIAMASVFIVVFSTMVYSTIKSRKSNIIDELRSVNF